MLKFPVLFNKGLLHEKPTSARHVVEVAFPLPKTPKSKNAMRMIAMRSIAQPYVVKYSIAD